MRKKMATLFLLLCLTVQLAAGSTSVALAEDTDYNLGFENMAENWTQYGTVTVETQMVVPTEIGTVWTINPHGERMAVLTPSGANVSPATLQATMGLADSSIAYINSIFSISGSSGKDITNMAYIYQDIQLSAGQELKMSWNYVATDYVPWNDASLLCAANIAEPAKLPIINGYYSDVSVLGATVPGTGNYSTGSYGSTGWQTVTVKAAFAGTYRLGYVVFNLGDIAYPPYLFVEDMAGTTLKDGENFEPIDPDDNPPPMQPVQSLNYDVTLFNEAAANDGSVTDKAVLTLTNETFTGAVGSVISAVTFENTPAGLTPVIKKTGDNTAELSFTGKASPNGDSSDISNFRVIFGNSAFTGGDAAKVLGSDTAILGFDFDNAVFTVAFYDADGNLLSTQQIEEGGDAVPPTAPEVPGYTFDSWSAPYEDITGSAVLNAVYTANTDTPYIVEYYVPNEAGDGYVLKDTVKMTGTTDSEVTAPIKAYDGLAPDETKSVLKGTVAADGSLVLAVYYKEGEVEAVDTGDTNSPWGLTMLLSALAMTLVVISAKRKALQL
jgi:hypothetical protein